MRTFTIAAIAACSIAKDWSGHNWEKLLDNWDEDQDGSVSTLEFLQQIEYPNADQKASEYPVDHKWWNDHDLMSEAYTHVKAGAGGNIDGDTLAHVIAEITTGGAIQDMVTMYADSNHTEGLTQAELGEILDDWAGNDIRPVPDWFGQPDAQLYQGYSSELIAYVKSMDQNDDGYATLRDWLEKMGRTDSADLVLVYGEDYKWWTDRNLIAEILYDKFVWDMPGASMLDLGILDQVIDHLGSQKVSKYVYGLYAQQGYNASFLTENELADLLFDWAWGTIADDVHPWFTEQDSVLYSGLRGNIKQLIKTHDYNEDDRVTAREFLTSIGASNMEDLLNEYGAATQWWRNTELMERGLLSAFDDNNSSFYESDELERLVQLLGVEVTYSSGKSKVQDIIQIYGSAANGLTRSQVEDFLHHWLRDSMAYPIYAPTWVGQSDEQLYGSMWEGIKNWVLDYDNSGKGYVDFWTFASQFDRDDDWIWNYIQEHPGVQETQMWWRDAKTIMDVVWDPFFDRNSSGAISEDRFRDDWIPFLITDELEQERGDQTDSLWVEYKNKTPYIPDPDQPVLFKADGQLMLDRMLYGILDHIQVPYWWHWTDAQLYGDVSPDVKSVVLSHDHAGAGKVTLEEFLTVTGVPNPQAILDNWAWDTLWWKDPEVVTQIIVELFDTEEGNEDFLTFDEMTPALRAIDEEQHVLYIVKMYGNIHDGGIYVDDFRAFVEDWVKDRFVDDPWGTPWWFLESDEVLYAGLNPEIVNFISNFDIDGDARVSLKEMLQNVGYDDPDAVQNLVDTYGLDVKWWTVPEIYRVILGNKYENGNGGFDHSRTPEILRLINMHESVASLTVSYGSDPVNGLTLDDLAEVFYDWATNQIKTGQKADYWWFDRLPSELYGGMRDDFASAIAAMNTNTDSVVTLPEVLHSLNVPNAQTIISKYGADAMWWHDIDFYNDVFIHWADQDKNGEVSMSELQSILVNLNLVDLETSKVLEHFGTAGATSLTAGEFTNFMWQYAHGELGAIMVEVDRDLIQSIYAEFQTLKGHGASVLAHMTGMDTALDNIKTGMVEILPSATSHFA